MTTAKIMPALLEFLYREFCRARLAEMRKPLLIRPDGHEVPGATRASLKARDETFPKPARTSHKESRFLGFCHHMEKTMTKVTFVSAALIAAAVFTTQAVAAHSDVATRHARTKAHTSVTDCVRAPDVGAFASDPILYPLVCPIPLLMRSNSDKESGWRGLPARLPWESAPVDAQSFSPPHRSAMHACGAHLGEDDPLAQVRSPSPQPT